MVQHMYEDTISITLYLTYAAGMIGLMVCSILSPIRTVTVHGRHLRLYGVAVSFDVPPLGWNVEPSGNSSSSSSSSSSTKGDSSVAALNSSYSPSGARDYFSVLTEVSQDLAREERGASTLAAASVTAAAAVQEVRCANLRVSCEDTARTGGAKASQHLSDADTALAAGGSPTRLFSSVSWSLSSLSGSASAQDSFVSRDGGSSVEHDNRTQWLYLGAMPSSVLTRCMIAYLVFVALSVLFSFGLVLTLFMRLLPVDSEMPLRIALRGFIVAGPLCAILCFAMAAVLGLQGKLVRHVADGYYANTSHHAVVSRLNSGFSTTVAAAFIALIVVTLSPVLWKQ